MIAALAAAVTLSAAPDPLGERIAQSAAAAQSLQGPLDGTWTLRRADGGVLYVFQITDPPDGSPVAAAWRDPANPNDGPAAVPTLRATASTLSLTFGAPPNRLALHKTTSGAWRGSLTTGGRRRPVVLARQTD